jgi:AhpD family alkylhydroperoxidase
MALWDGELCVCQMIELLGLAPSTVSKHISILRPAELLESRKDGRWIYYRLPVQDLADTPKWMSDADFPAIIFTAYRASRNRGSCAVQKTPKGERDMATEKHGKARGFLGAIWNTMAGSEACCAPGSTCCTPSQAANEEHGNVGKQLKIYDPPMCCSTGMCGPNVDAALVRFATDIQWVESKGVAVERFNLTQSPKAFAEEELVRTALTEKGEAALPLLVADGKVLASGGYPSRDKLAALLGLSMVLETGLFTPAVAELVAIGAAIAANCEPCLRYHVKTAVELGVTNTDIARAVEMAAKVKDVPHQAVLKLAGRLAQGQADHATVAQST